MKLKDLFQNKKYKVLSGDEDLDIQSIEQDARKTHPGSVFFAIKGEKANGHQFIAQAIKNNCTAIVIEEAFIDLFTQEMKTAFNGAVFAVENSRKSLDEAVHRFFLKPSENLFCIGVTGTNGKTSLTYLCECLLNYESAVMGTVNHHYKDNVWMTDMTTPDPINLQKRLKEFVTLGAKAVAMEISSHALAQHRADSVQLDCAIFTNLTHDHLDYHGSLESYFSAKKKLFSELVVQSSKSKKFIIINADDSSGEQILNSQYPSGIKVWSYGKNKADFCFQLLNASLTHSEFLLKTPFGEQKFYLPLLGEHNIYNATAAIAAACAYGVSLQDIAERLRHFSGVPGRLQKVDSDKGPLVFIDYAHTPDALEKVLLFLKKTRDESSPSSKIKVVFGCGGDRDNTKRPLMGEIASRIADVVYVTSDNPRSEVAAEIAQHIVKGIKNINKLNLELDRKFAIQKSIESSSDQDIILIAGKGHENYQIIGITHFPFSDYDVAKGFLK